MNTSQLSDLEELLNRHLRRDPNGAISAHVLNKWKADIANADTVKVEWVESYGPKLRASWFNSNGVLLASTARPPSRAESVRSFVRDWEEYMQNSGRPYRAYWADGTGSSL